MPVDPELDAQIRTLRQENAAGQDRLEAEYRRLVAETNALWEREREANAEQDAT